MKASAHSTLLSALKTNRPIPKPIGSVTPGALNLIQASIKLMAPVKPIQISAADTIISFNLVILNILTVSISNLCNAYTSETLH